MDPEYEKRLIEFEAAEEARRRSAGQERPYSERSMNTGRMPIGCFLWIMLALCGVAYLVGKMLGD